jgi:hypothetical protein
MLVSLSGNRPDSDQARNSFRACDPAFDEIEKLHRLRMLLAQASDAAACARPARGAALAATAFSWSFWVTMGLACLHQKQKRLGCLSTLRCRREASARTVTRDARSVSRDVCSRWS